MDSETGIIMEKDKLEKKYYTVSEIAKTVGITRNKTWSYIRKNKIKPIKKTNKLFYFDYSVVSEIANKQHKKYKKNSNKSEDSTVSSYVLNILEKQLSANQEIIENLRKTIENQHEIIDYLKRENIGLNLDIRKKEELLEDVQKKKDAISDYEQKQSINKNKWWKIFKKNR